MLLHHLLAGYLRTILHHKHLKVTQSLLRQALQQFVRLAGTVIHGYHKGVSHRFILSSYERQMYVKKREKPLPRPSFLGKWAFKACSAWIFSQKSPPPQPSGRETGGRMAGRCRQPARCRKHLPRESPSRCRTCCTTAQNPVQANVHPAPPPGQTARSPFTRMDRQSKLPRGGKRIGYGRSDRHKTQRAASGNAARCDARRSALRWQMHRTGLYVQGRRSNVQCRKT